MLANRIPAKYQSPHYLLRSLHDFVESRVVELVNEVDHLCDWPGVSIKSGITQTDVNLLRGSPALRKQGRSGADELLASGHCVNFVDRATGNIWYAVPRTLWKIENKGKKQCEVPVAKTPCQLESCVLRNVCQVQTAASREAVQEGLTNMGLAGSSEDGVWSANVEKMAEVFEDWCFVVVGPLVKEYWDISSTSSKHELALCIMCSEQCIHGPCEHTYAALVNEGSISVESITDAAQAGKPGRPATKTKKRSEQEASHASQPPPATMPGPRALQGSVPEVDSGRKLPPGSSAVTVAPTATEVALKELLSKAGVRQRGLLQRMVADRYQVKHIAAASDLGLSQALSISLVCALDLQEAAKSMMTAVSSTSSPDTSAHTTRASPAAKRQSDTGTPSGNAMQLSTSVAPPTNSDAAEAHALAVLTERRFICVA